MIFRLTFMQPAFLEQFGMVGFQCLGLSHAISIVVGIELGLIRKPLMKNLQTISSRIPIEWPAEITLNKISGL